jgi:DNA-binding CsgD family transcriptional regulator
MTRTSMSSLVEGDNEQMTSQHPRSDGPRRRRVFTPSEKLAHLNAYEAACEQNDGGGYLRREGRYSGRLPAEGPGRQGRGVPGRPGPSRPRRDGARPQVIAQLLAGQRRDSALAALTARERQLLALMAEGHSNTAIAQRLVLSASAVEKHIGNVFAKLGLPPDDAQHRRVLAVLAYLRA